MILKPFNLRKKKYEYYTNLRYDWQDIEKIKKKIKKDVDNKFLENRLNELRKKKKVEFGCINERKFYRKRKKI